MRVRKPDWLTRQRLQVLTYLGLAVVAIIVASQIQANITERTIVRRIQPQIDRIERRVTKPTVVVPGKPGLNTRVRAGQKGKAGVAGANGSDGAIGARGAAGVAGSTGARGPRGVRGPRGAQGPRGPAGVPGVSQVDQTLTTQVQNLQHTVNELSDALGGLQALVCALPVTHSC